MSAEAGAPRPLALTMGEPGGIGGEIAMLAWLGRGDAKLASFVLLADPARLAAEAKALGLNVPLVEVGEAHEAMDRFADALPVLPVRLRAPVDWGRAKAGTAAAVLESIATAVALVQRGEAAAVVTNPIQKDVLYGAGFRHPGHTEYLAELAGGGAAPVMMLACPALRVVPVTIHLPLRRAIESLTIEKILHAGRVTAHALRRDFALAAPRLAITGLNPHAGEGGTLGHEEQAIIEPAAAALRAEGITLRGPLAADSLFHAAARATYDAVLCMYHDQALIPIKTLDFEHGVNVTLGLPFVRTSPDHGTALGIAGRGVANPSSLIAALQLAREMADARASAARAAAD